MHCYAHLTLPASPLSRTARTYHEAAINLHAAISPTAISQLIEDHLQQGQARVTQDTIAFLSSRTTSAPHDTVTQMAILPLSFGGASGASYRPLFSSNPLQAHPLHFALTALLFLACIGLYNRDPYPTRIDFISTGAGTSRELTLSQRLQRSEDAFQRSIASRAYLYQQYGKDPESFPSEPPCEPLLAGVRQLCLPCSRADSLFPRQTPP